MLKKRFSTITTNSIVVEQQHFELAGLLGLGPGLGGNAQLILAATAAFALVIRGVRGEHVQGWQDVHRGKLSHSGG
jgi:hypothetical protein